MLGNSSYSGLFNSEEEAAAAAQAYKEYQLAEGDTVIGESFTTTVQPQTSFVIMDQATGYVKAISGGRGEKKGDLTLNRATDSVRDVYKRQASPCSASTDIFFQTKPHLPSPFSRTIRNVLSSYTICPPM